MQSPNAYAGKDSFRKEFLAAYRDSILGKWFEERNESIPILSTSQDNELFKELYEKITGKELAFSLKSNFSKLAVFLRCEIEGERFENRNGEVNIYALNSKSIRFVFKALSADNNIHCFNLVAEKNEIGESAEIDFSKIIKNKEFSVDIQIPDLQNIQRNSLELREHILGDKGDEYNRICHCSTYRSSNIKSENINSEELICVIGNQRTYFYYIKEHDYWIGKISNEQLSESKFIDLFQKYKKNNDIRIPTDEDVLQWKEIEQIQRPAEFFWIRQHPDGRLACYVWAARHIDSSPSFVISNYGVVILRPGAIRHIVDYNIYRYTFKE